MNRYSNELVSSNLQFSFKPKHSAAMLNLLKLFHLLLKRNMPSVILTTVVDMYTRQSVKAPWNGSNSCPINVSNGVRQGGVLSPILFNVYMDGLLKRIQKQDIGCHFGTVFMGALCYADDLISLSPTRRGLQKISTSVKSLLMNMM